MGDVVSDVVSDVASDVVSDVVSDECHPNGGDPLMTPCLLNVLRLYKKGLLRYSHYIVRISL